MSGVAYPAEVKAEAMRRLQAGEKPLVVARELGIARATAYGWKTDPTGETVKARKERYRGVCADCGGPTSGNEGRNGRKRSVRCRACATQKQHDDAYWTRERITEAVREWVRLFGKPPSATAWNTAAEGHDPTRFAQGHFPTVGSVRNVFGSWNAGIAAAGFQPNRRLSRRPPNGIPKEEYDALLTMFGQGATFEQMQKQFGVTGNEITRRLTRLGVYGEGNSTMPTYNASAAIDRDIARTQENITQMEESIEERRAYLAALKVAKEALSAPQNGKVAA